MTAGAFFGTAFALALLTALLLAARLRRVREQLSEVEAALEEIAAGNLNRRVLAKPSDMASRICYGLNGLAVRHQAQLVRHQRAAQAYKRFLTGISHDVKTPLASLSGYLEAIEYGVVSGEERDAYLRVAYEKSQRLNRFVEHLFEWVKLDSGEQAFHFAPVDCSELTRSILADWVAALEGRGFAYAFDIPEGECRVRADADAYRRILDNLLQNALLHSGGDAIAVRVAERGPRLEVTVADNGRGIPAEHLPHIFERLYQCGPARSAAGNGLGLAIVRELAAAHGGTVAAESVPGQGAAFTLSLPKEGSENKRAAPE